MGTNNNNENNLSKKLKFNKRFYIFKTKFNRRQLKTFKSSTTSLSTISTSSYNNSNSSNNKKIKLKFSLCGDPNCGKTSLLFTYIKNSFPVIYQPTIVDDHEVKATYNGEQYTLSLYDTAGQEDWETLRIMAYPDTDVIVLCFSVVRPDSMENVKTKWIPELYKFLPNTPIILVGTQCDLRGQQQQSSSTHNDINGTLINRLNTINNQNSTNYTTTKEGEELAKRIKAFKYIECSALTQQNISEVFEACIIAYKQGQMPVRENCFRKLFTSCLGSRINTCARSNNKSSMSKYKN